MSHVDTTVVYCPEKKTNHQIIHELDIIYQDNNGYYHDEGFVNDQHTTHI